MGWSIGLSEKADLDLGRAVAFLARKNPAAAERLGLKLVETIFSLQEMPHRGVEVRDRPGYRRILHWPWFLIFYRINEERRFVEIVRVWDARQDPAMFAVD
jgi:plasmid stabilization system protein ParE